MKKEANLTWVHLFSDFVRSGAIAEMGPNAFAVLMTVKAHAALSDGESCPSAATVAKYTGISQRQVTRELSKLEKLGHLKKTRTGRANNYILTETIQIKKEGEPAEVARFHYAPVLTEQIRSELKNYLESGNLPEGSPIVIQQLNVNVQFGENNTIANIGSSEEIKDLELRKKLESAREKFKKRNNGNACG